MNDVLALKDADCSIAMASGSEAAAQASQLVLAGIRLFVYASRLCWKEEELSIISSVQQVCSL